MGEAHRKAISEGMRGMIKVKEPMDDLANRVARTREHLLGKKDKSVEEKAKGSSPLSR